MKHIGPKQTKHGFTLIELLVVIAIIAILAAILFPIFTSAKKRANQTNCGAHLKQISTAVMMYASDNGGRLPRLYDSAWFTTNLTYIGLKPYIKNDRIWQCPGGGLPCDFDRSDPHRPPVRYQIDYRFNDYMQTHPSLDGSASVYSKMLDSCTNTKKFYMVSDRHSNHHFAVNSEGKTDGSWIMLMVMADGHLSTNTRPYVSKDAWDFTYNHWDFPNCHGENRH